VLRFARGRRSYVCHPPFRPPGQPRGAATRAGLSSAGDPSGPFSVIPGTKPPSGSSLSVILGQARRAQTRGSHEYLGFKPPPREKEVSSKICVRPPGLHLRRLRPRATILCTQCPSSSGFSLFCHPPFRRRARRGIHPGIPSVILGRVFETRGSHERIGKNPKVLSEKREFSAQGLALGCKKRTCRELFDCY
jgi:hypothetical protein